MRINNHPCSNKGQTGALLMKVLGFILSLSLSLSLSTGFFVQAEAAEVKPWDHQSEASVVVVSGNNVRA